MQYILTVARQLRYNRATVLRHSGDTETLSLDRLANVARHFGDIPATSKVAGLFSDCSEASQRQASSQAVVAECQYVCLNSVKQKIRKI